MKAVKTPQDVWTKTGRKPVRNFLLLLIFLNSNSIFTSNDHPSGCWIIYTDTNSQWYFIHRDLNNAWHNNAHSHGTRYKVHVLGTPCLTIISSITTVLRLLFFQTFISTPVVNFNHLVTHFLHRTISFIPSLSASFPDNDSSRLSSKDPNQCKESSYQPMKLAVSPSFWTLRQYAKLPRHLLAGIFPSIAQLKSLGTWFYSLCHTLGLFSVFSDNLFREIVDHFKDLFTLLWQRFGAILSWPKTMESFKKWVATPIWSDCIVFNQSSIASIIAVLSVNRP